MERQRIRNELFHIDFFVSLLVVGFYVSREFFSHIETPPLPIEDLKFLPILGTRGHCAVGFLCLPHLLWNRASVYNGHQRRPVTLTYVADRLAMELSLHFLFLRNVSARIRTPNFRMRGKRYNRLCHRVGLNIDLHLRAFIS